MNLDNYIASIPDYPIEGVLFRDVTPLMGDGEAFHYACQKFVDFAREVGAEVVVGPESRGFIFGCPVAYELEEYTMPICVRHNVPYRALNLTSYLSLSEIDIRVDARNIFAIEQITWMINAIISILVGLLCGGSGIALIAGGLKGIAAGAILSLGVLLLGREHMEKGMMDLNLPKPLRRIITRSAFAGRMRRISPEVKANFHKSLEKEKNEEISERLVREISDQIEECLTNMARVVEIPLG